MQSTLAYYGLIPEYVAQTLSVSTQHPSRWHNALVDFRFQYLAPHLIFGYQQVSFTPGQEAFISLPEKALLDLVHLTTNRDNPAYLDGLRLQNRERLDRQRLQFLSSRAGNSK